MYRCESWTIKKTEHRRTDAFKLQWWKKLWESLWQKGDQTSQTNQLWILFGKTDAEAPILWPPDGKSWLVGKDPNAGKVWGQEEKGDQKIRWLDSITNSAEDSEGQGSLACYIQWGCKESDITWRLNNSNNKYIGHKTWQGWQCFPIADEQMES